MGDVSAVHQRTTEALQLLRSGTPKPYYIRYVAFTAFKTLTELYGLKSMTCPEDVTRQNLKFFYRFKIIWALYPGSSDNSTVNKLIGFVDLSPAHPSKSTNRTGD